MWHIWLGRIALLILLVHMLLASFRFIIKLNYETWRFVHNLGAVLILPLGFFHSWKAGGDFKIVWMKALWAVLLFVAVASYLWHRVVRTILLRRRPYKVTEVREEADGVWTIKLAAPEGVASFRLSAGTVPLPHLSARTEPAGGRTSLDDLIESDGSGRAQFDDQGIRRFHRVDRQDEAGRHSAR